MSSSALPGETRAVCAHVRSVGAAGIGASGILDLDDAGAEAREQKGGKGPCERGRKVQNSHVFERTRRFDHRLA